MLIVASPAPAQPKSAHTPLPDPSSSLSFPKEVERPRTSLANADGFDHVIASIRPSPRTAFERANPTSIGIAGPPGTGKTLLARAVAGECGAHVEIVNGPALLSKRIGETESALRSVFERAQKFTPAVILFDEIDSIAPSRSAENAQHQISVVAQLLVLLDGIEERGQIFVLATTNRHEHIDPALRRPGRFDQVVWMGLPDERGRAKIFEHYLRGLKLESRLTADRLATELASVAEGLTGADIAYVCQRAAMFCVKESVRSSTNTQDIAIARNDFDAALGHLTTEHATDAHPESLRLQLAG
jgi:SpoVK/Ycf46/Vps4 family AAA+-type ATPase